LPKREKKEEIMTIQATAQVAMTQALEDVEHAAAAIARATQPQSVVAGDRADLSTEAVQLLAASRAFEAAAELAKTADEVAEATIDLLA
jgi:hypothetical protein